MSVKSGAHVRAIQTLGSLRDSLSQFAGNTQEALISAEREIQRTREWLKQRENHWRRIVEQCRRAVEQTRHALAACERACRSRDRDDRYGGSCSCASQEAALARAEAALKQAEANLAKVKHWQGQVDVATRRYQIQSLKLESLVTNQTEQAKALLKRKQTELEKYQALVLNLAPMMVGIALTKYNKVISNVRNTAVQLAKNQEIDLVRRTGEGTRNWSTAELRKLKRGEFPKGYHGHHINNVQRFPELAGNPDNIRFVKPKTHIKLHFGDWHNNTSGKMYNRKSMMVQWAKHK